MIEQVPLLLPFDDFQVGRFDAVICPAAYSRNNRSAGADLLASREALLFDAGSDEVAAVLTRAYSGQLAKGRRERARFPKTEPEGDLGHGPRRLTEQRFCPGDATRQVITVRRHAERLLEGARKVEQAQSRNLRERRKRDDRRLFDGPR